MNIKQINSTNFNGTTKFLSCNSDGKRKRIAEYLYGSSSFGDTRGLTDLVQRWTYPYAYVEETIGKYHNDKTFKVYIADPNEIVKQSIKQSHDYIVYDKLPDFPDVKKKYFTPEYTNLKKEFQYIFDYYKRLENTSKKIADANNAKRCQQFVSDCIKIFDESFILRDENEKLKFKITSKTKIIDMMKSEMEKYKKELDIKKETLPNHKRTLSTKDRKIVKWTEKLQSLKNNRNKTEQDVLKAQDKLNNLIRQRDILKEKIEKYDFQIAYYENYIENAQKRINEYLCDIENIKIKIKILNQEIKPNYKKLCDFYTSNGIKIFRNFRH